MLNSSGKFIQRSRSQIGLQVAPMGKNIRDLIVKRKPPIPTDAAGLRRHAEGRLRERWRKQKSAVPGQRPVADAERTLHELQVHQIELEMQNTELQEARDRIEAQLEKYTDLYDFAPVGYFSLDEKGVIQEVNLTGAAMLGVERSRLINQRMPCFVDAASQPDFLAFLKRVFAGSGPEVCDLTMVREDDAALWARFRGTVALAAGDPRKWCRVSVSDITAFQHADEARARLAAIVESSDDAIIGKDLHGIITSWNRAAERLFGYTEKEAVGQPVTMLMPADLRVEETRILESIRRGETVQHYETTRRRKDGTPVEVSLTVSPLKNARGEIVGAAKIAFDITARKQAEDRLRAGEAEFRAAFEQSAVGMGQACAKTGRIIRANAKFCELTGYSAEELAEMTPADLNFAEDRDADAKAIGQLLRGEVAFYEAEKRCVRKDGGIIWIHVNATLLRDADGRPERTMAVIQDITERKEAIEALRASEEFSRTILQSSPDCVKVLDGEGRLQFMNTNGMCAMEIDDFAPFLNQPWWNLWGAENTETIKNAVATALQSGTAHFQALCPTAKGTIKWWDVVVGLVAGSNPKRIVSISRDITERQQAEEKLRASEERFRAAVSAVSGIVWTNNAEGEMAGEQPVWGAFTGQRKEDYQGYGWSRAVHPEDAQPTIEAWNLAVAEKRTFEFEHRVRRHDGQWRVCSIRAVPVLDSKGRIREWVGVHTDITKRKQMEQELQMNNLHLEARVMDRTARLRSLAGELTQAEERERRRIAHILHDELQQLLVGATVHLEIMRKQKDPRSRLEALRRVEQLIQESNDVARGLSHELSPVALQHGNLAGALKWLAGWMDQNHRLTVRVEAEAVAASVEDSVKVLLFQSVRELLFNVVKHAGVKRAQVRMTETREGQLEILVSDLGKGFDAARTTTGGETSAGLGLFSIRERLHLLGGRMEVQSASGRGSRFRLLAPLQKPAPSNAAPKPPLPAPRAKARPSAARIARRISQSLIRVVLADDHKVMRDGLAALLAHQSEIEVVGVASDGKDAIKQARKLQPDLVVMDINMPRMDGIQATREITATWPGIKVIGLTMHADARRHEAMLDAGAVNCLSKSSLSRDLIKTIHAAFAAAPTRSGKPVPKKPVRTRVKQV